jgi:hypothetical protein
MASFSASLKADLLKGLSQAISFTTLRQQQIKGNGLDLLEDP